MSFFYKIGFGVIIAFSLFFASWYVLNGDIYFHADIGRDFHLLREIDQKKIILIGPRASGDLFHGPGWPYINYPFYLLGHGNPIVVGWGWVLFTALFGIMCFVVSKKLFDKNTAYLFTIMATLYVAFHARGMINPHGVMILLPLFFFTFVRYYETLKPKYLVFHLLIAGIIAQIELMSIPYIILSFVAILYRQIRKRQIKQVSLFLIILVLLSNFIIFDLRHDFIFSKKVFTYVSPERSGQIYNYASLIENRVRLAFAGPEIIRQDKGYRNLFLFLFLLLFIFIQVNDKKYKTIYFSFLYFYFGFFILSLVNKGQILYFHQFPIFPLVLLVFSSLMSSRYKTIFIIIFAAVLLTNLQTAFEDINNSKQFIGKDIYSWKFLSNSARKVFEGEEKDLGYFVYSPDVFGYEGKYAMIYASKLYDKKSYYFQKKPVTYLFIAPPPQNNPYMKDEWWRKNQLNISSPPSSIMKFENGYKIEKYNLSDEEISIPFDPAIDPGIHFR